LPMEFVLSEGNAQYPGKLVDLTHLTPVRRAAARSGVPARSRGADRPWGISIVEARPC
jgi:hypothetical protein